jgi:ATP-dependent protease Clp ATPase subunit
MLALPPELEQSFRTDLERFEEARRMPYVTSTEKLAREEGHNEGHKEGVAEGLQIAILKLLELKFKKLPAKHERKLRSIREIERLGELLQAANDAETIDEALAAL